MIPPRRSRAASIAEALEPLGGLWPVPPRRAVAAHLRAACGALAARLRRRPRPRTLMLLDDPRLRDPGLRIGGVDGHAVLGRGRDPGLDLLP